MSRSTKSTRITVAAKALRATHAGSTASTLPNESGKGQAGAIERQLAHQDANEIRGAYTHAAEFWQERRAYDAV